MLIASFLIVAGLTGALLVWYEELDHWFSADIRKIPASSLSLPQLDAFELHERLQKQLPCVRFPMVDFRKHAPGTAVSYAPVADIDANGDACTLNFDEVLVDPATGDVVGKRKWGDLGEGWVNFMPFIYRLHTQLALGVVGTWAFGFIALLWMLDCFVGAYLTFPIKQSKKTSSKKWWKLWGKAWKFRFTSGYYKLNFDLHRAGGLWLWAMLFVFAWSSVALNFSEQVYKPVMHLAFKVSDRDGNLPRLKTPLSEPSIGLKEAHIHARHLMNKEGRQHGFDVVREENLSYDESKGVYYYSAKTTADIRDKAVFSSLAFDGNDGQLKNLFIPTGRYAGDTITMWLYALHLADIWGMPYRLFVCFFGIFVGMLSVTGVVIWWKKRRARIANLRPVIQA